jgi:hypothetical protein
MWLWGQVHAPILPVTRYLYHILHFGKLWSRHFWLRTRLNLGAKRKLSTVVSSKAPVRRTPESGNKFVDLRMMTVLPNSPLMHEVTLISCEWIPRNERGDRAGHVDRHLQNLSTSTQPFVKKTFLQVSEAGHQVGIVQCRRTESPFRLIILR